MHDMSSTASLPLRLAVFSLPQLVYHDLGNNATTEDTHYTTIPLYPDQSTGKGKGLRRRMDGIMVCWRSFDTPWTGARDGLYRRDLPN